MAGTTQHYSPSLRKGLDKLIREPTSGLEPLTCLLRVIIHMLQGYARACDCPYLGRSLFKCVHAMSDFGQPYWSAKQWHVKLLATLTEKVSSVRLPFGGLAALQSINLKFCIIQHNNRVLLYTAVGGGNRGEEA